MAIYGCTVNVTTMPNKVVGTRGFGDYLEQLDNGLYVVRLDPSLAANEFSVSARAHSSALPGRWSVTAAKFLNPPAPRPPGTYVVVVTTLNGVPQTVDFDIIVSTFN
jgi:hypothetical protein